MLYIIKGKNSDSSFNATVLLVSYLCVLLMQQFLILPMRLAQLAMLVLGVLSVQFYKKNRANEYLLAFFLLYTLGGLLSWIFNKNADIQEYLWIVSFGGIALLLLNETVCFDVMKVFYYSSMGLMCLLIIFSQGVDNLHMASSRNTISSMGILLFSIYTISAYQCNRKIHIMSAVVFVITALLGIGRSGVLLSGLLLISFLLWDINKQTFCLKNPYYICITIIVLGILFVLLYNSVIYPALYNISWRGIMSQSRLGIWTSYIEKTCSDLKNILFGAHVSGNIWLDKYSFNLHNSFLNLHSKYGFGVLLLIIVLTFHSIVFFIKKKQLIILIPFLAVVFRAQTDYTNFNGTADFVWYYYMFLPFFEMKKKRYYKSNLKESQ